MCDKYVCGNLIALGQLITKIYLTRAVLVFATGRKNHVNPRLRSQKKRNYVPTPEYLHNVILIYYLAVLVIASYGHSCLRFTTCEAEPIMGNP